MMSVRRLFVLVALAAVAVLATAGPAVAQQYPPDGVEAEISCSATVVAQGGEVTCTVTAQAFQAGTSVTASATSSGAQSLGAGPAVANVGTTLLAQSSTDPFSLTEQVTAAGDGSAAATFQIPVNAETGPVTVTFSGTAPDGTDQVITKQGAFRVVSAEAAGDGQAGGLAATGANSGLWIGIAAALVLIGGGSVWLARRRQGSETRGG